EIVAHRTLGTIALCQNDNLGAIAAYDQAALLALRQNDQEALIILSTYQGAPYLYLEDYPHALACFRRSLEIAARHEQVFMLRLGLTGLGRVYAAQGHLEEAS